MDDFLHGSSVAAAHVAIRMGFIRKVLGILSVQLLCTSVFGAICVFTPGAKGLVQQVSWLMPIGLILSIGLLIAMLVKRHETPTNYWLLAAWTIVESYTVGVVTTFYDVVVVVEAVFLTAAVVIALFVYSFQTTRDFSSMGAGLFSVLWVLVIAGILQIFLMSPAMEFMIAVGGAVLFSLFIVVDLHLLMHKLSPEEYILATINLYLDIINLFLHILRLIQSVRRD
jgi:FtsH-binding integral membrane protein